MRKWTIRKLRGCVFPFCIHISFCHVSLWFFSLSKKKYYPPFNTQCEFTISLTSSTLIHFHVYVMPRDAVSKNVCTQTFKQLHAHRSIHKKKLFRQYTPTHVHTQEPLLSAFQPARLLLAAWRMWLVWNPTQSSYTVMCCFALWSSLSGASINRAIVWSALPKGFTPISVWGSFPIWSTFCCWSRKDYGVRVVVEISIKHCRSKVVFISLSFL